MPYIPVPENMPGIVGLFAFRPETAKPLTELGEVLLRSPNSLSPGERELIASYVSSRNGCFFWEASHGAVAAYHFNGNDKLVQDVKQDPGQAAISEKLKALLNIAEKVRLGGHSVQPQDVERARKEGATDHEIHDTVLIAAAFCMYNRYVDGLATWAPEAAEPYKEQAVELARHGYLNPIDKAFAAASDAWLSVQKPTSWLI